MKVAIDGFNLGLSQGTGIATYARELSQSLSTSGHSVYPVYAMSGVGSDQSLAWARFLQKLATLKEADRKAFVEWMCGYILRLPGYMLGVSSEANAIEVVDRISTATLDGRLPVFSKLFNVPSLYRDAQAFSYISKKHIKIKLDSDSKPDIFHLTCPLPIEMAGVPSVVTAHDLIPIALPSSTTVNLKNYRNMVQSSLDRADVVLAVSEHSKRDIVHHLGIAEDKIRVTYQSVRIPDRYKNLSEEDASCFLRNNYGLEFGKYFIFYGAIEPKKNVSRIIDAFSVAKTKYPLVVVGKNGWLYQDVANFFEYSKGGQAERFNRLPYATFEQLMYLVRGARGLVFPSLYEGFGLPVLEAMHLGCPVITSNVSSLPEVGGDAAHYVDPTDTADIAKGIDTLDSDAGYRAHLIEQGHKQCKKFTPEKHVEEVVAAYEAVI